MAPQPAAVMRAGSPNRPLNGSPAEQRPTFPGLFNRGIFSANRPGGRSSREGGPQVAGEGITLKAPNPLQGRCSCSSFSKHLSLVVPFGDSSELVTWRSEEDSELRVSEQKQAQGPPRKLLLSWRPLGTVPSPYVSNKWQLSRTVKTHNITHTGF